MSREMRAGSLYEAVEIASHLEREGAYDYFRGQRQAWPIRSSLSRCDEDARGESVEQLFRFRVWATHRPRLSEEGMSPDHAVAIAQHYGIPTDFIDITRSPEVAGFFASDGWTGAEDMACIYCFDAVGMLATWKEKFGEYRSPRVVEIDVKNLWRLQSQEGAFLDYPYGEVESWLEPDRILFPLAPRASTLARDRIYPKNESALELELNQFFHREEIVRFSAIRKSGNWHEISFDAGAKDGFRSDYFSRPLVPMPGWGKAERAAWSVRADERYSATVRNYEIEIPVPGPDEDLRTHVLDHVRHVIDQDGSCRSGIVRLSLEPLLPEMDKDARETLASAVERLWDGVRGLPVSNSRLAASVANAIVLGRERFRTGGDLKIAVQNVFGTPMVVEFQATDRSYSRSVVAQNQIMAIVRDDLATLMTAEHRNQIMANASNVLYAVFGPAYLFAFDDFARLFVEQVVPAQVLYRPPPAPFLVSPADLDTFGRT